MDNVPITVLREIDDKFGSVQLWIEETKAKVARSLVPSDYSAYMKVNYAKEEAKMKIFDVLIGNADRHQGNYLIGDKALYYIDNGFSMPNQIQWFDTRLKEFARITTQQLDEAFKHLGKKGMSKIKTSLEGAIKSKKLEKEMNALGLGNERMYMLDRADWMIKYIGAKL